MVAGFFYLVIGFPLTLFIYFRLDLLSVLLAVSGLALIRRGRERSGGFTLAMAVLTKLWPIVLLPLLIVRKNNRALAWCGATVALGVGSWIAGAGLEGPVHVITFRHSRGWEIGSLAGSLIHLFFAERPTIDAGAARVGYAPLWARLVLLAVLLLILRAIWLRAAKAARPVEEVAVLTAVAALLALSPILSDQYVVWLVPWAATAAAVGQGRAEVPRFLLAAVTALSFVVPAVLGGTDRDALWYGVRHDPQHLGRHRDDRRPRTTEQSQGRIAYIVRLGGPVSTPPTSVLSRSLVSFSQEPVRGPGFDFRSHSEAPPRSTRVRALRSARSSSSDSKTRQDSLPTGDASLRTYKH